jgi:hypothetical protein
MPTDNAATMAASGFGEYRLDLIAKDLASFFNIVSAP